MLICDNCSNIFTEDETVIVKEEVGEFWGTPAYEEWSACPYCHSTDMSEYNEENK